MQVKALGEFGLISRIARMAAAADPMVVKAIGDDAAVVSLGRGRCLLVTTDLLKEGVHFRREFSSAYLLGKKCLSVNMSDIAAMGGEPTYYVVSLAVPPETPYGYVRDLYRGMAAQARRFGAGLLGGDTTASSCGLVVSITLLGVARQAQVVYRRGARPGDLVYVTGTPGDSALGLALLERGEAGPRNRLVRRHLDPQPRLAAGRALARSHAASAMIDISDGLAGDLRHIMEHSGVGARIFLDRLPLSAAYRTYCPSCADNFYLPALGGGEDYELLFAAPAANEKKISLLSRRLCLPMTCIGRITEKRHGLKFVGLDGRTVRLPEAGFRHF